MSLVTLRRWQHEALLATHELKSPIVVATPGAGKTTFAVISSLYFLNENKNSQIIIVVPTRHLKRQWSEAAKSYGLKIYDQWEPGNKQPEGYHGFCVTYAQLGRSWGAVLREVKRRKSMIILDEVHHAGTDLTWGDGVTKAFNTAQKVLSLSGTPYRSDSNKIPFISYSSLGTIYVSKNDYTYGYKEALKDGVVRPVIFEAYDGEVTGDSTKMLSEMTRHDTKMLHAILDPEGEWVREVLTKANLHLQKVRRKDKSAAGIVFCRNQAHAKGIQKTLTSICGKKPPVVVSENSDSSSIIEKFSDSNEPWIISVRMISEGVDIPRLKTGVYLTTTRTPLFFAQAVGRILRKTSTDLQEAKLFIPSFKPLLDVVDQFQETRSHFIDTKEEEEQTLEEEYIEDIEDDSSSDENEYHYVSLFDDSPQVLQLTQEIVPETYVEVNLPFKSESILDFDRESTIRRTKEYAKIIAERRGLTMSKVISEANRKVGITNPKESSDEQIQARLNTIKDLMKNKQPSRQKLSDRELLAKLR